MIGDDCIFSYSIMYWLCFFLIAFVANCMPGYSVCQNASISLCAGTAGQNTNMCKIGYYGYSLPSYPWGVVCRRMNFYLYLILCDLFVLYCVLVVMGRVPNILIIYIYISLLCVSIGMSVVQSICNILVFQSFTKKCHSLFQVILFPSHVESKP